MAERHKRNGCAGSEFAGCPANKHVPLRSLVMLGRLDSIGNLGGHLRPSLELAQPIHMIDAARWVIPL